MSEHPDPQQPNSGVSSDAEQIITATWHSNSRGDIARVSIQFFLRVVVIDICEWSYKNDEMLPRRNFQLFCRARNLPRFAEVMARAVAFGREQGFIPADAVEAEVAKDASAEEQRSGDAA